MGIRHFALGDSTVPLDIGARTVRVGLLRDLGKSGPHVREAEGNALRAWSGRRFPALALAPSGRDRWVVLGWEDGLGVTNDHDWSRLPVRGEAALLPGRERPAAVDPVSGAPLTDAEALAAGFVDAAGKPRPGRRPRVVAASALVETHPRPAAGTAGANRRARARYDLTLDTGEADRIEVFVPPRDVAEAADAMVGLAVEEAFRLAHEPRFLANPRRSEEIAAVRTLGGAPLAFAPHGRSDAVPAVRVIPVPSGHGGHWAVGDPAGGGLLVTGEPGGPGFAQTPVDGLLDLADRLAQAGGGPSGKERPGALRAAHGWLALAVPAPGASGPDPHRVFVVHASGPALRIAAADLPNRPTSDHAGAEGDHLDRLLDLAALDADAVHGLDLPDLLVDLSQHLEEMAVRAGRGGHAVAPPPPFSAWRAALRARVVGASSGVVPPSM